MVVGGGGGFLKLVEVLVAGVRFGGGISKKLRWLEYIYIYI